MSDLISEVKAALQAATPGNWFVMHDTDIVSENPPGSCDLEVIAHAADIYDAKLIGNSKGWLQQLTDRLETAERQREEAVKALEIYADEDNWGADRYGYSKIFHGCDEGYEPADATLKRIKGEIQHESENC